MKKRDFIENNIKKIYEKQDKTFEVISYQDTPDAKVKIDGKEEWIDIEGSFIYYEFDNSDYHLLKPIDFLIKLKDTIFDEYKYCDGQGILIIGLNKLFIAEQTVHGYIDEVREELFELIKNEASRFHSVYFYYDGEFIDSIKIKSIL